MTISTTLPYALAALPFLLVIGVICFVQRRVWSRDAEKPPMTDDDFIGERSGNGWYAALFGIGLFSVAGGVVWLFFFWGQS